MTFKEKLQMDCPSLEIPEDCVGIGCPYHNKYEKERYCNRNWRDCKACWNREMPNTETKAEILKEVHEHFGTEEYDIGYAEGLERGLNDAWELAKKIYIFNCDEIEAIFGLRFGAYDMFSNYTPQEALAKMKAYEEQRNIEVGDIVLIYGEEAVVTRVVDEHANILFGDGVTNNMPVKELVGDKTGKHIDIKSFLEQIGE